MTVTAKDLRFNTNMLFDLISKGEEVSITYRGKVKAKLIPSNQTSQEKDDSLFGLWKDSTENIDDYVRSLRKGRSFDL